jgi:PKD repeat protein
VSHVRFPRLVPKDAACAGLLAKRTLTNLYNKRPTWLDLAHRKLDEAVFATYGWRLKVGDHAYPPIPTRLPTNFPLPEIGFSGSLERRECRQGRLRLMEELEMSTEVARPGILKGWVKAIIGTFGGLIAGAMMMYLTPWIDKAIKPDKPLANFAVEHDGLTVTFRNRSLGGSEGRWDFGDGSPIEIVPASEQTITHTYPRPGTYTAKLMLRNLIDDVNERSVTIEISDGGKPKFVEKPQIVDLYVKPPGKTGEPVFAPATIQFQATADNAQMYIWDFGDGKGIQMGDYAMARTFEAPGTYPVKVIVFNGPQKTVRETVVEISAPPANALAVNLKVADHGVQIETRRREVPVSGAATISGAKSPLVIEQTIAAAPGYEIVRVDRSKSQNQNIESTEFKIAPDKHSVKITAKLAKASGTKRAVLYEHFFIEEQRKEKATREPTSVMAMVGVPGSTTVRLPAVPGDWADVKRELAFELVQGDQVLWRGNELPQDVPVSFSGRTYTLAAALNGEKVQVNLRGNN